MPPEVRAQSWVDRDGYRVVIRIDGKIAPKYTYSATNNWFDSQGPVQEKGVPIETLQKWARGTAKDLRRMAEEDLAEKELSDGSPHH